MPVPSGKDAAELPALPCTKSTGAIAGADHFGDVEELERILKARLVELSVIQQRNFINSLEQSRTEVLQTVSECLVKAREETFADEHQGEAVTSPTERGSGFAGVSFAASEFSNQEPLPLDDWVETADLEVLGLEVGKVDTSNFFSWLRVKLAKCEHRVLDVAVSLLIALNTMVMMLSHQQMGHDAARAVGEHDATMDNFVISQGTFTRIEQAFAIIIFLELSARVMIHRLKYFKSYLNIFDALLVVVGIIDMIILEELIDGGGTMRLFQGLRVLVAAVSSFLPSLFASMFFLAIFIILGGLLVGTSLMEFIKDESKDLETRRWVWESYGTSYRATYTMFQVTFSGCWPSYVNPLFQEVSMWYALFFCIYVTFVVFAVMRVITAIFLKETLDAAGEDHEVVTAEKEANKKKYMRKLERIFCDIDVSGDGLISEEEFTNMLQDEQVKKYLVGLEVDLNESSSLFQMMADEDGQVSYSRFMDGMNRAKGLAKAADILCIRHDLGMLRKDLKLVKALSANGLSEEELSACYAVSRVNTSKPLKSKSMSPKYF